MEAKVIMEEDDRGREEGDGGSEEGLERNQMKGGGKARREESLVGGRKG